MRSLISHSSPLDVIEQKEPMIETKAERSTNAARWSAVSSVSDWPERAHRELVVRIVKSKTFARSERLSTLLSYVCDMTLKGRADELNEQKIGSAVFGRAIDYDSSIDGIVRTQASRLRQRLGLYFEEEGAEEPVRILIPKGGYIPLFEARPAREELASERLHPAAGPPSMQTSPAVDIRTDRSRAAWILCAILALAVVGLSLRAFSRTDLPGQRRSHTLFGVTSSLPDIPHWKCLAILDWCCSTVSATEASQ